MIIPESKGCQRLQNHFCQPFNMWFDCHLGPHNIKFWLKFAKKEISKSITWYTYCKFWKWLGIYKYTCGKIHSWDTFSYIVQESTLQVVAPLQLTMYNIQVVRLYSHWISNPSMQVPFTLFCFLVTCSFNLPVHHLHHHWRLPWRDHPIFPSHYWNWR